MKSAPFLLSALVWFAGVQEISAQSTQRQSYPIKPIRMLVPGAPGGLTDSAARALAPGLGSVLGQPVIVDSRAGAAGLIACDLVAKAPPDGYTLLFGFSGPLVIAPHLNKNTPYNTVRDFTPIALVATAPYVLIVNPGVPAQTVKELVALAKTRPGKLNYASGGVGTGIHLSAELFNLAAGIKTVHVSYKAASPALVAVLGGEVDMMFVSLAQALPHLKAGKIRALAVGGGKRHPALSDVPTVRETGYPVDAFGWYGVLAPHSMSSQMVLLLNKALGAVLHEPAINDHFLQNAFVINHSSPEQFSDLLRAEMATWAEVVKTAGIKDTQF
jgi:tripartite-type tricarboxylate transporter receptor subunit TctC